MHRNDIEESIVENAELVDSQITVAFYLLPTP